MITLRDQLGDEAYIKYLERELAKAKRSLEEEGVRSSWAGQVDCMSGALRQDEIDRLKNGGW